MGNCLSGKGEELHQNQEIEDELKRDKLKLKHEVKILLLGAGESGKSTLLKQMRLIHHGGFSEEERISYKDIIVTNLIQSLRNILVNLKTLNLDFDETSEEEKNLQRFCDIILSLPTQVEHKNLSDELILIIHHLWKHHKVQTCYEKRAQYQLNDSAKYYLDEVDRIAQDRYIPSEQDVLRSRVKTTGISETTFHVGQLTYRMIDVGGQRSERKKWIHCFENVGVLLFMVALSEYDQNLIEDENVNRMLEALNLFDSVCNSRWFIKSSIILFLNKIDLFKQKLNESPVSDFFPDYKGHNNYESASKYFLNRFISLNQQDNKQIYVHFTCATDTNQIKFVMAAVDDMIVQNNLKHSGLL